MVNFSTDLVVSLNLAINYSNLFGRKVQNFDETLTYTDESSKFTELIMSKDGYLDDEENYFTVGDNLLSEDTKASLLKNSRVILYWRGLKLEEKQVKRILTLGLLFLIGQITQAQIYLKIRDELPKDIFEVKVQFDKNRFVLIGIEKPIFKT